MPNMKHLFQLSEALDKKDINLWNRWKENSWEELVDLSRTNLPGVDLVRVNLNWANLRGSMLEGTILKNLKSSGASFLPHVTVLHSMVRSAKNWENAFYDLDTLRRLDLSSDHNEKLQKGIRKTQSGAANKTKMA